MLAFLIVTAFVGIILGLRFNVFVLVPAILLAIAAITLGDIATRQSVGVILATTFAAVVLLQIGYITGRVLKVAIQARWPTWTLIGHQHPSRDRQNQQSRPRKSAQDDKWSFCLMTGTLCPANQERP
jgi:membrane protein DedA with SNARE-associated domain